MIVNEATVDRLAELSRLSFDAAEKEQILNDLNKIIGFVEKLNEINVDGVEPLIYMTPETNILRKDTVIQTLSHEEALMNAPAKDSDYIRVPKVLDR
jgi:aspartyl-tRNA(Asn)/glutamyl-tRNA(Gln) amidotransferase subunit C